VNLVGLYFIIILQYKVQKHKELCRIWELWL